jgi:formylglycine-generating enzyme required for sulfatase activity
VKLGRHPLAAGAAPAWATTWGDDALGVFAGFSVGDVVHRMRWVPSGSFMMGSPEGEAGRFDSEGPMHQVTLTEGYWLGETPVTQALWNAVTGTNPSHFKGAMRPVETVSWRDCVTFIETLNEHLKGLMVRLPTEAEWERACRAGTVGPTWRGDNTAVTLARIAWYIENSGGETHDVGMLEPNPLGLHDMLGNVWEWCSDRHGPYASAGAVDPTGAVGSSHRVMRGGSLSGNARVARAAARTALRSGYRETNIGFRLAQS